MAAESVVLGGLPGRKPATAMSTATATPPSAEYRSHLLSSMSYPPLLALSRGEFGPVAASAQAVSSGDGWWRDRHRDRVADGAAGRGDDGWRGVERASRIPVGRRR